MKILFIGESWHIHMIHSKGFDSFTRANTKKAQTIYYPAYARVISM